MDVNDDKDFSLADTITVLRVLAGYDIPGVSIESDMNGDGKIGMEEALFQLRMLSGF
jgi:hypothetical protein